MKEFIKNLYQKLQNTKVHLWSHIMALVGWIYIYFPIYIGNYSKENFFVFAWLGLCFVTGYIFLPIFIFALIEHTFLKKFKIKWTFLIKNPFYNLLWLIGLLSTLILSCMFIIVPLYNYIYHLIQDRDSDWEKN